MRPSGNSTSRRYAGTATWAAMSPPDGVLASRINLGLRTMRITNEIPASTASGTQRLKVGRLLPTCIGWPTPIESRREIYGRDRAPGADRSAGRPDPTISPRTCGKRRTGLRSRPGACAWSRLRHWCRIRDNPLREILPKRGTTFGIGGYVAEQGVGGTQ